MMRISSMKPPSPRVAVLVEFPSRRNPPDPGGAGMMLLGLKLKLVGPAVTPPTKRKIAPMSVPPTLGVPWRVTAIWVHVLIGTVAALVMVPAPPSQLVPEKYGCIFTVPLVFSCRSNPQVWFAEQSKNVTADPGRVVLKIHMSTVQSSW